MTADGKYLPERVIQSLKRQHTFAGYLTLGFLGAAVQPVRLRQRHPECFSAGSSNDGHSDEQLVPAQQKQTGAACTATDGDSLAWPQL